VAEDYLLKQEFVLKRSITRERVEKEPTTRELNEQLKKRLADIKQELERRNIEPMKF